MPNILLTGATGFIGQAVAVALAQNPAVQLTLLVREVYGLGTPLPAGLTPYREQFQLVYADLRTPSLVNRAVQQKDADDRHKQAKGCVEAQPQPQPQAGQGKVNQLSGAQSKKQ